MWPICKKTVKTRSRSRSRFATGFVQMGHIYIELMLWLRDCQAASKSRIQGDRQSCDSKTAAAYWRWNLFSMSLVTKLTLILTLNNPHNTKPGRNRPSQRLNRPLKKYFPGWKWNLQNVDRQPALCWWLHWCLYDIEFVWHIVYLNLRVALNMSLAVP